MGTSSYPGTTLAAQERHALAAALRQDSVQDVSRTLALYDQLVEAGRRDSDFAGAQRLIDSARPSPAFASYWSGVDERWWEFLKRNQDHDPIPDTLRLSGPHLVISAARTNEYLSPTASGCSAPRRATRTATAGRH